MKSQRRAKVKKNRLSRRLTSKAWLSKKKARTLSARKGRSYFSDRWPAGLESGETRSPEDRDLELALNRIPFRIQRVAKALSRGASFKTARFDPVPFTGSGPLTNLWEPLTEGSVEELSRLASLERWRAVGVLMRSLWPTRQKSLWDDRSGFASDWRGPSDKKLWPLWDWMEASGADMWATDDRGEGFEHFALRLGNRSALEWWKSKGRGPSRPGSLTLAQAALARDQLFLMEDVDEIWPEAGLLDQRRQALEKAVEEIQAYWGEAEQEDGSPKFSRFSQIRARAAAARAAEAIVAYEPDAAQPNRGFSDLLSLLGVRAWRKELMALEDAAMARAERDALSQAIAEPLRAASKSL